MFLDSELEELLKQSPKKDGKHTHTIPGRGAYYITKENLDKFYKLVHKEFFINDKRYMFVEKIQDVCSLVIDLDIKYKDEFFQAIINIRWKSIKHNKIIFPYSIYYQFPIFSKIRGFVYISVFIT